MCDKRPFFRLALLVLAQFLSGSIWFAANAVWAGQGLILSAVQLGFIAGTLGFAIFNLSDRFSAVQVYFLSSLAGALANLAGIFLGDWPWPLLISRFFCGLCLAGIYPVGMKIAASWFPHAMARALGLLVGALVLASGFPFLIRGVGWQANPAVILGATSTACLAGGVIQVLFVKDGPFLPRAPGFNFRVLGQMFSHPGFRAASLGYFGHMWELYALFAHVPRLFGQMAGQTRDLWIFGFFAAGGLGCLAGGIAAQKVGSRRVALVALMVSGSLCLASPWFPSLPPGLGLGVLLLWGAAACADSPQFSSLNARFAPRAYVGSALTLVNCLGFLITILTIEVLDFWIRTQGLDHAFLILAPGPLLGWFFLKRFNAPDA